MDNVTENIALCLWLSLSCILSTAPTRIPRPKSRGASTLMSDLNPAAGRGVTLPLRIIWTLCHGIALVITTFRLVHRRRRKQFSWDDTWALVAVVCNTLAALGSWARAIQNDQTVAGNPPSKAMSRANNLTMSLAFTCAVWSARISIACGVLRILPSGQKRRLVLSVTCIFGLTASLLLFFKCWTCFRNTTWVTDCPRGQTYNIAKFIADTIADATLVAIPLHLLWNTTIPKAPRLVIRAVFAMSILTTAASAVHAIYGLGPDRYLDGVTAHFESAITVIVCNLLVVVTFLYRRFRNGRDLDDEVTDYLTTQAPRPRRRAPITFMSFTKITQTQLTTFFSTRRRGSSLFFEGTASANAARNNHPSFTSSSSSTDSQEWMAAAKAAPKGATLSQLPGQVTPVN